MYRLILGLQADPEDIYPDYRKERFTRSFDKRVLTQLQLNLTVKLTKTDEKTIRTILAGCKLRHHLSIFNDFQLSIDKIHNCDVMIREDVCHA